MTKPGDNFKYRDRGPYYGHELREICRELGYLNFVEGIKILYLEGKSQSEIAKIFKRTQPWVSTTMKWMDMKARPKGGANFKGKRRKANGREI